MLYLLKRMVRGMRRRTIKSRPHYLCERSAFRLPPRGGQARGKFM